MVHATPSPLLALPLELRELIYECTFEATIIPIVRFVHSAEIAKKPSYPGLLCTSKQVRQEALVHYYKHSLFTIEHFAGQGGAFRPLVDRLQSKPAHLRQAVRTLRLCYRRTDYQYSAEAWARVTGSQARHMSSLLKARGVGPRESVFAVRVVEDPAEIAEMDG
ncbi:hypothetical protein LTR53_012402 [Teratosphaeriaceae sp. CCFEE 6253]|nr:hypothetical protein LTR53_012402 [Teratosphaeriaceae sp. CCFEE 6253]